MTRMIAYVQAAEAIDLEPSSKIRALGMEALQVFNQGLKIDSRGRL